MELHGGLRLKWMNSVVVLVRTNSISDCIMRVHGIGFSVFSRVYSYIAICVSFSSIHSVFRVSIQFSQVSMSVSRVCRHPCQIYVELCCACRICVCVLAKPFMISVMLDGCITYGCTFECAKNQFLERAFPVGCTDRESLEFIGK